jgi:hypothetical protein
MDHISVRTTTSFSLTLWNLMVHHKYLNSSRCNSTKPAGKITVECSNNLLVMPQSIAVGSLITWINSRLLVLALRIMTLRRSRCTGSLLNDCDYSRILIINGNSLIPRYNLDRHPGRLSHHGLHDLAGHTWPLPLRLPPDEAPGSDRWGHFCHCRKEEQGIEGEERV